ncbi:2-alkenal reductase [Lamprobacter modestohalophilus]|uniref:2-alkenal reductase n=1 Tax=Lamprobacter modestohalophilus TaxID=1064514 RepID=A0A9X0W4Z2_9GAMM|nr:trypsin-like peptidase domain-containing protein [Lamprobacter modestohalophilus]MBK1616866.1 2-alkenal reductase [Lamprobacter modestohalophilus]MCF7977988.1 trypsin-like peptidase domain-containing protein [Chromatiaceae bacterium]MCF8017213.1 trypsin-like peptidase domain-containing protein [Chromatiaceae bacterium]
MHGFQLSRALFWSVIAFLALLAFRPWIDGWLIERAAVPRPVTARGDLAADEESTIAIFDAVSPSVVFITTTEELVNPWARDPNVVRRGTGSGFVWDGQRHIVTNWHVIAEASAAWVRLADQRHFRAELIGKSPAHDLAVLRISGAWQAPEPIPIGRSADLRVGQKVFAIGNPFGLDYSLTSGVVSALDRAIYNERSGEIRGLIQTDAAINPGNSGGPLIDSAGRLIGINSAIFSTSGTFSGIGFAVPVDTINRVVPQLIARGRYIRPRIGITADDAVSRPILRQLGLEGVLVLGVGPGSPADIVGLVETRVSPTGEIMPGDIIQRVDGQPVAEMADLIDILEGYQVGDRVTLSIIRDGRPLEVAIHLGGESVRWD